MNTTSYQFYKLVSNNPDKPWNWEQITTSNAISMNLVLAFPDRPWKYYDYTKEDIFPLEFILKNPDKPWNWDLVNKYKAITFKDIVENPNIPWDLSVLSETVSVTCSQIQQTLRTVHWHFNGLSQNKSITIQDIDQHFFLHWNWSLISQRDDLTVSFVEKHSKHLNIGLCIENNVCIAVYYLVMDPEDKNRYVNSHTSKCVNLPFEYVSNNNHLNWDWFELSQNKTLTKEFIEQFPNKDWNWEFLCARFKFPFEYVFQHYRKDYFVEMLFDEFYIECNTNLDVTKCSGPYLYSSEFVPISEIIKTPNFSWNWNLVSSNKTVTFYDVFCYPDRGWNWSLLSQNESIPFRDIIGSHTTKTWYFNDMYDRSDIDINFVEYYPGRWDFNILSTSPSFDILTMLTFNNLPWNKTRFSQNPNVTESDIEKFSNVVPWNYKYLTHQPKISYKYISEHPDLPWDWENITEKFSEKLI